MEKICIAFLGVLFVALVWANTQQRSEPSLALTEGRARADVTLSEILFVQTRNGSKDWELKAQEAQLDKDQTAFFKQIFVTVPAAGPEGSITLRGAEGRVDLNLSRFFLRGGKEPIFVQWGKDYTIETASLGWSPDTRTLVTSDPVKILGEGIKVTGTGMSLSSDRSEATIYDVHAEWY